jgi:glycosyltransferase involved in cell wall biosynthesis
MDCTVCVSEAQAVKVRRAGVPAERVEVIRNAVGPEAFEAPDAAGREEILRGFARPPRRVVGAAGRLSPEKGFDRLVEAAALVARADPEVGFVVFGDGPLRPALEARVGALGLGGRFVLAGFRPDVRRLLPQLDLVALPSFTEGLPVVLLEAFAAGVPVVATAVGGTPEVLEDGVSGYLVPAGDPGALAGRIVEVLRRADGGRAMGRAGRERVRTEFTFETQAVKYRNLFARLRAYRPGGSTAGGAAREVAAGGALSLEARRQ